MKFKDGDEILTIEEKEYLSAVIRPFRERVIAIEKVGLTATDYINIRLYGELTALPSFKKGKMYKGMQTNKEYTLDELDL